MLEYQSFSGLLHHFIQNKLAISDRMVKQYVTRSIGISLSLTLHNRLMISQIAYQLKDVTAEKRKKLYLGKIQHISFLF